MKPLKIIFAVLLFCLSVSGNAEAAAGKKPASFGRWIDKTPSIRKVQTLKKERKIESAQGGGVKFTVKAGRFGGWAGWTWKVNEASQHLNRWKFRATIDRLDRSRSGIRFGHNLGISMTVSLSENKLALVRHRRPNSDLRSSNDLRDFPIRLLREVTVRPEHQKPGTIVMTVEVERDTNIVKCSIDDTEYMSVDVSEHGEEVPVIGNYGFFNSPNKVGVAAVVILRKMEIMQGN